MKHSLNLVLLLDTCTFQGMLPYLLAATGIGALISYLIARNFFQPGTLNPQAPFSGMNPNTASTLVQNYQTAGSVSANTDANSVWFTVDKLMSFLIDINQKAGVIWGNGNVPDLGVRIYYGRYPADATFWNNNPDLINILKQNANFIINDPANPANNNYAGRHTVIMVPTYKLNGTTNVDFDPTSVCQIIQNGTPITLSDINNAQANFMNIFNNNAGNNACICNHGEIVPPPDPVVLNQAQIQNQAGNLNKAESYGAFLC